MVLPRLETLRLMLPERWLLSQDEAEKNGNLMTCYKLVRAEFKWFGLQGRVEKLIHSVCRLESAASVILHVWTLL